MRKARYLAAGIAALAKPFFLAGLASGLQLSDGAQLSTPFLRYLLLPQTVPALCLFFLWQDEHRYEAFRPLAAILALASIALLAFVAIPAADNFSTLLLAVRDAQGLFRLLRAALGILAADLLCLFVLIPESRRKRRDLEKVGSALKSGTAADSVTTSGGLDTAGQNLFKEP
jgi:hypothetical protein